jgi:hypothetical protein
LKQNCQIVEDSGDIRLRASALFLNGQRPTQQGLNSTSKVITTVS